MKNQIYIPKRNPKIKLYQFELPLSQRIAPKAKAAWQRQREQKRIASERIHTAVWDEDSEDGYIKRPNTRVSLCSSSQYTSSSSPLCSPTPCASARESHDCVSMEQDKSLNQNAQRILVSSALRRPHATQFSPLDYQSMPDVGKSPRQPYKSNSASTVLTYANRPLSATESPRHLGKHTKSSLLRSKSASIGSLDSTSSHSSCASYSSRENRKLCAIRDDYRFFKSHPHPKQVPPHGQSMHAFLTGARYNSVRHLDCRTLSKLGVYIPKDGLNTFFVKDEPMGSESTDIDSDVESTICKLEKGSTDDRSIFEKKIPSKHKAVNTDPHYLSISRWHSPEWKSKRCKANQGTRAKTAPLNRYKAVKSYYYDYDRKDEQKRPESCR